MIDWVNERYNKQADKRSSVKKVKQYKSKKRRAFTFFESTNLKNLQNVFDLQNLIVDSKLIIINKLNSLTKLVRL